MGTNWQRALAVVHTCSYLLHWVMWYQKFHLQLLQSLSHIHYQSYRSFLQHYCFSVCSWKTVLWPSLVISWPCCSWCVNCRIVWAVVQLDWFHQCSGIHIAFTYGSIYFRVSQWCSKEDENIQKHLSMLVVKLGKPQYKMEAVVSIKQISEAYEILSDPLKHTIYNQNGEEGLKLCWVCLCSPALSNWVPLCVPVWPAVPYGRLCNDNGWWHRSFCNVCPMKSRILDVLLTNMTSQWQ